MKNLISLDIETSAADLRGNIISIGLVNLDTKEEFYSEVKFLGGLFVDPKSMAVNQIKNESFLAAESRFLPDLDNVLSDWVPFQSIAMGRGISYFDMDFIEKDLPFTFRRFSRRLFDLSGYLFGIAGKLDQDPDKIRKYALEYMEEKMVKEPNKKHHALWDAKSNVYFLEFLNTL